MTSLVKKPQNIFYIGQKSVKHDTVAGTGLVWAGFGDSHEVPHTQAVLLMQHPDVWCNQKRFSEITGEPLVGDLVPETHTAGLADVIKPNVGVGIVDDENFDSNSENLKNTDGPAGSQNADANADLGDRAPLIINAILSLDSSNTEHFSEQTGQPKIDAVRAAANDETLTVKEINAAWKALKTKKD